MFLVEYSILNAIIARSVTLYSGQQLTSESTITEKYLLLSLLQSVQWVEQYIKDKQRVRNYSTFNTTSSFMFLIEYSILSASIARSVTLYSAIVLNN